MIINSSNEEMVMRKEVIITDWDGILQIIEYEWMRPFRDLYDKVYKDFFSDEHLKKITFSDINSRDEFYLTKWLAKPGVTLTDEQYTLFEYPYLTDTYFYNRCNFLNMFDALMKMVKEDFCSEIIILTQTQFGYEGDPRKQFIFENIIQPISDKFRLIQIPLDKPKWEYIKENNIYFTVFIDDRGDIIEDVANNCGMIKKYFIIPKLGYNYKTRTNTEFIGKLEVFGSKLIEYDLQVLHLTPNDFFESEKEE